MDEYSDGGGGGVILFRGQGCGHYRVLSVVVPMDGVVSSSGCSVVTL